MSKQAFKRVRKALGMTVERKPLDAYAWPGGYPIIYVFNDGGTCCPDCVNKNITLIDADMRIGGIRNSHGGWALGAFDIHYEGEPEICDHCHKEIESAYGTVEEVN